MSKSMPIVLVDPSLKPFMADLQLRETHYKSTLQRICVKEENLSSFANAHLYFGFHKKEDGWVYREWAPYAKQIMLIGDFNGWNRKSHPMSPIENGVWEIKLSKNSPLAHKSQVKIEITTRKGDVFDRIPLYSTRVLQDADTGNWNAEIWTPEEEYSWQNKKFIPNAKEPLLIYEAHIGMSSQKEGISSFAEFTASVLPRVKKLGYNTIQLMAIAEHSYYASFGYQVTDFFAVSSRFGTPDDFKRLIDTAHGMGIAVLFDLVHSHASPNTLEGIAAFDGTDYQFFCRGKQGNHPAWGTKLFDYGKGEVLHFLLSNIKYWLEEYHLDGFRFDGVTSMLYHNHALGQTFSNYAQYFSMNTNYEALTYLKMATVLCHQVNPHSLLLCEDMSGMPGLCLPVHKGGIGFNYRLGMGLPDYWIRTLRHLPDEKWNINELWHELSSRRPQEKVVAYCESHDQALVGDKTIFFRLADKEMYEKMSIHSNSNIIERAMALHKMIRLISCTAGGDAYLNFMGNEFGHPEWVDFPREGNGWSYQYATRKWNLADDATLRYQFLQNFDAAMLKLIKQQYKPDSEEHLLFLEEMGKVIVFEKNNALYAFNFHPTRKYKLPVSSAKKTPFHILLNTCWDVFGGQAPYNTEPEIKLNNSKAVIELLPRTAMVFAQK